MEFLEGCSVKLYGGYDFEPEWIAGKKFVSGKVDKFIPGQNSSPAMVVELDMPLTAKGATGNIVIVELRFVGAQWKGEQTVHIELCNFIPENKSWKNRRQGTWIESHASVAVLEKDV